MKRFAWVLIILMLASPAWAAKKLTLQQLRDLLISLHQDKKNDVEVAAELEQVELTEELTRSAMNSLVTYISGPHSSEQIYVLQARSAVLAPPAADLPATPAPDASAQKAILDKAIDYSTKTYAQLPHLTATKTTIRFQNNVQAIAAGSSQHSSGAAVDPNLVQSSQFVHYINSTDAPVDSLNGVEKLSTAKDKTPWDRNGSIALLGQSPVLTTVLQEAQSAGKINWLRWETVNGKQVAVYTFSVDKKNSHYAVNYCCFPDVEQTGAIHIQQQMANGSPSGNSSEGSGNFQTAASWINFKATVPYHGEIFVDPDTGIVLRLISHADFKPTELVRQEDQRIDYGPVTAGAMTMILPVKTVINTEVVPNGDSDAARVVTRRTLFISEYKNYQAAH
jgi:hypothetical protein